MAFNLAAAAGANLNSDFLSAFQPVGPVAARDQVSGLVARNDSSGDVVNMFIDGESPNQKYAASIIDACRDQTTYALRCTAGSALGCGSNGEVLTVTAGPSTYRLSTAVTSRTAGHDVKATLQETCDLQGTTKAVCHATLGGSVDKTTTSESVTSTLAGTDYHRYDVAITGGAEKTANPTAECKPPGSGASTKAVAMWGLLGAVGVASLLGF